MILFPFKPHSLCTIPLLVMFLPQCFVKPAAFHHSGLNSYADFTPDLSLTLRNSKLWSKSNIGLSYFVGLEAVLLSNAPGILLHAEVLLPEKGPSQLNGSFRKNASAETQVIAYIQL